MLDCRTAQEAILAGDSFLDFAKAQQVVRMGSRARRRGQPAEPEIDEIDEIGAFDPLGVQHRHGRFDTERGPDP